MPAWVKDLNPKYQRMDEMQSKIFVAAALGEVTKKPMSDEQKEYLVGTFLIQVLRKRIEVLKLPIVFGDDALLATLAFVDRPGQMMVLLIDCLNAYEGKTVTAEMLADLYPTGFYDEDTFCRYVDDFIKERKVKWAEIY